MRTSKHQIDIIELMKGDVKKTWGMSEIVKSLKMNPKSAYTAMTALTEKKSVKDHGTGTSRGWTLRIPASKVMVAAGKQKKQKKAAQDFGDLLNVPTAKYPEKKRLTVREGDPYGGKEILNYLAHESGANIDSIAKGTGFAFNGTKKLLKKLVRAKKIKVTKAKSGWEDDYYHLPLSNSRNTDVATGRSRKEKSETILNLLRHHKDLGPVATELGLSAERIGEDLGCSPNSVHSLMHKFIKTGMVKVLHVTPRTKVGPRILYVLNSTVPKTTGGSFAPCARRSTAPSTVKDGVALCPPHGMYSPATLRKTAAAHAGKTLLPDYMSNLTNEKLIEMHALAAGMPVREYIETLIIHYHGTTS